MFIFEVVEIEIILISCVGRFLWNNFAIKDFADRPELSSFCMPILHGFIDLRSSFINGRTFDFALISRRSAQRAGTRCGIFLCQYVTRYSYDLHKPLQSSVNIVRYCRYFVRGIDDQGDVANYVETEQIVIYAGNVCSFVQTRGSIPLYWSQRPNLRSVSRQVSFCRLESPICLLVL